jgi:predicted ATP-dependent endonuclease of OLD family
MHIASIEVANFRKLKSVRIGLDKATTLFVGANNSGKTSAMGATGITDYLKSDGTLEHAQTMAAHSSPRTTKLYDRRNEETALDEYEKVRI